MRFAIPVMLLVAGVGFSTEPAAVRIEPHTRVAVGKALDWLHARQQPDGSWGNTANTAFALLAFLSDGHVPDRGRYGPATTKAVRSLLAGAGPDGYLVGPAGGNMYSHGLAALALSQVYGMTAEPDVRRVLKKAVDLTVRSQNHEGGWRYDPAPSGADVSATITQVMALRGAKDGGLFVPDETFRKALKYIDTCRDAKTGGYRYQPFSSGPGYARTAAGLCVLQLCGEYDARPVEPAAKYLGEVGDDREHFWYGHYYAAHGLHQLGGRRWADYYARVSGRLLAMQKPTGEWNEEMERESGPVYQTAVAVLVLDVPTHYLPIYQR